MTNQFHYDNHANDIEYFNLHKPKIEVQKKREDIKDFSDDQLAEKLDDAQIKLQGLTEMYNAIKSKDTYMAISKLTSFITCMRIEMRNRKIEPYKKLNAKVAILEQELSRSKLCAGIEPSKESDNSELLINNLKSKVHSLKDKNKNLGLQIEDLKGKLIVNKEAEKTKRHELNVKNDKYACAYLLEFIKNTVTEKEYLEVLEDLQEIRNNPNMDMKINK